MVLNTISLIVKNRELIWEMALRDLKGINKGSFLGYFWLVISPLIQVAAYVVIVSFVFKARLRGDAGPFDYALYVLSGMIPWQIITRSIQESPSLIRERMDIVKQVIYPIETLPLNSLLTSSFGSFVAFFLFLLLSGLEGKIHWGYFLLPFPCLLLLLFVLGLSWIFSIAGVIFKDLREIVGVTLGLLVYLSPVVVSESMVGRKIWNLVLWNPLSHIIICFRDIFYAEFHLSSWVVFLGMAGIVFIVGAWVIARTKILINEYI